MIDESAAGLETFRHLGTLLQTFANVCMPHSVHKPLLASVQGDLVTSIATPKYQTNPRRPGVAGLHVPLSSPLSCHTKIPNEPSLARRIWAASSTRRVAQKKTAPSWE